MSGINNSLEYNECCNDFMIGFRNSAWSARAWQARKHCYKCQRYQNDFKAGFRAGYEDVASGGNGCTPTFPPRTYWGWKYQSPEGQLKVAAWFQGYPMGAKAAEQDGLGYHHEIQMCSEMEQACQACQQATAIPMEAAPANPTPPQETIPGIGALLSEGESIVGEVQIQKGTPPAAAGGTANQAEGPQANGS